MADVTIDSAIWGSTEEVLAPKAGIFWTSTSVGYCFFIDGGVDFHYRKSTDSGATWGTEVAIKAGNVVTFSCWADWQTSGDTGTKIHLVYLDTTGNDIRYVYLDTSTDTVAGDDQIEACQGSGVFSTSYGSNYIQLQITKSRGGKFYVAIRYPDNASTYFESFYVSSDGNTWTSKTSPFETSNDQIQLYPANLTDADDIWALFWDTSADALSLKTYTAASNNWTDVAEAAISANMVDSGFYTQMDGNVRLSDGHLIVAAWNQFDNAASDLNVWDITNAGTITAKVDVITNEAENIGVSVFINQANNNIYVAYLQGTAAQATTSCSYKLSTDGGASWGAEVVFQQDAEDDMRWVSCGVVKASLGGRFQPMWFNDDLNDLMTNTANSISIAASGLKVPISTYYMLQGIR